MEQSTSKPLPLSKGAALLHKLVSNDRALLDEFDDARICNGISIDLYNLRAGAGLTQKELAEKLGVKQSNISRWEQAGYQGYKVKMLNKLVRTLGGKLKIEIGHETTNYLTSMYVLHAESLNFNLFTGDCNMHNPTFFRMNIGSAQPTQETVTEYV